MKQIKSLFLFSLDHKRITYFFRVGFDKDPIRSGRYFLMDIYILNGSKQSIGGLGVRQAHCTQGTAPTGAKGGANVS